MKNNCPCINCDARHVSCHSGCERYAAWKKQSAKDHYTEYSNRIRERDDGEDDGEGD